MKLNRLSLAVSLLGIGFLGVVWLALRGSESGQPTAKLPPTSLTFKGTTPRRAVPADDEETAPVAVDIGLPGLSQAKGGQLLMDMLVGIFPVPKPSSAAIDLYLKQRGRSAANLLAAWLVSGNLDYLREAAEQFEYDPQVQFAVLVSNAFPEDRGKWIAFFKQSSPYNPLAHYFAAQEYFRQNQTDQAVAEMVTASTQQGFEDYITNYSQACEELFLATGSSRIEAKEKGFAVAYLMLQSYAEIMGDLGQAAADARAAYTTAGDTASAQKLAQSVVMLGQQLNPISGARLSIIQTTGIEIEQSLLQQFPAEESLDWLGQSPAVRLADLQRQREQMDTIQTTYGSILPQLGEAEVGEYLDHVKESGESAAMQWLASRVPAPQGTSSPD
jgi:hypothetical protein